MNAFEKALAIFSCEVRKPLLDEAEEEFLTALSEATTQRIGNEIRAAFTVSLFAIRVRPDIVNLLKNEGWALMDNEDLPTVRFTKTFR